jgi:hypothetical protein
MNYNTNVNVNYKIYLELTTNKVMNMSMSETIYQENFLDVFRIKEYDANIISTQQDLLYQLLCDYDEIKVLLNNLSKKIPIYMLGDCSQNENGGKEVENNIEKNTFVFLFSYPLFNITHKLICEVLNNSSISNENIDLLIKEIDKM